jgi:hypothetical protein
MIFRVSSLKMEALRNCYPEDSKKGIRGKAISLTGPGGP